MGQNSGQGEPRSSPGNLALQHLLSEDGKGVVKLFLHADLDTLLVLSAAWSRNKPELEQEGK
jgi:hypothetical protein